jgi:AraC-like DNA-binding protein
MPVLILFVHDLSRWWCLHASGQRTSSSHRRSVWSDPPPLSIRHDVGFNNVVKFNRRFIKLKHITPREYRSAAERRPTRGGQESACEIDA